MLGDSTLREHIAKSNSLDIKPRVFAEWNANAMSNPFMYGTGTPPTFNEITTINASGCTPLAQSVNRGISTSIKSGTTCNLLTSNSDEELITINNVTVSSGVVTLKTKSPLKNTIGIGKEIFVDTSIDDINGRFNTVSGTDKSKIVYNTNDPTITNINNKTVRRSSVTLGESSYYIEYSANATEGVRFYMMLKSDYYYQISQNPLETYAENFDVILTAVGMKNNQEVLTQVSTKRVRVNAVDWETVFIDFANPDESKSASNIDKVKLTIEISTNPGEQAGLLVNQLIAFKVSPYEIYCSDIMPVKNIFSPYRPGEFLLETGPVNVNLSSTETFPQQCTNVHMAMRWAIMRRFSKVQRSVMPYAGNPNSYYVSGSSAASKKFWCVYKDNFKTNNIVVKVNSIINKPSNFSIKAFINNAWTEIATHTTASFNSSGILRIYYNGTQWSSNQWSYNSYPKISQTTGDIDKYVTIKAIAIEVNSLSYSTGNNEIRGGEAAFDLNYLDMVEISPRMSLDLSEYLIDFSINKEIANDSIPLPLGSISSNSATINFSKVPIIISNPDLQTSETDDIVPISNYASTFISGQEQSRSPLKGMLVRGVKIRGFFDIDYSLSASGPSNNKISVPAFVMYSETWSESNNVIKLECFDIIKRLQSTLSRPLYLKGKTVQEVVYSILDSVGFSEYISNELIDLRILKSFDDQNSENNLISNLESINHYWSSKENSVSDSLNDIFKAYQVAMYADETGAVRFTSLYDINRRLNNISSEYVLNLQDFTDSSATSNVASFSIDDNEKPSRINLRYKKPYPYYTEPKVGKKVRKKLADQRGSLIKETSKIVWEPEKEATVLPYFELSSPGITSKTQKFIKFNIDNLKYINRLIDYSGYLLINDEIVKYNGLEYIFTPVNISNNQIVNSGDSFKEIIKNPEDLISILTDATEKFGAKTIYYQPTGYIMNVERGAFGTTPNKHITVNANSPKDWVAREFDSKYQNVSSLEESDGQYSLSNGRISLTSKKNNGGILITPKKNNVVGNKRKIFARYGLGDIPANKSGYLGVAIGVKIQSGEIKEGLFIFTGIESKNKKTEVKLFIQEIIDGNVNNIIPKGKIELDETLFEENEQIELYLNMNASRNSMRVYVGPTSIFQKVKKGKDKDGEKTKELIDIGHDIKLKIDKNSTFGFVALEYGTGWLDDFCFTSKADPRNLNSTNVDNIENDYSYDEKAGNLFYIGSNTLLNQIVYDRNIELSINNPTNKDNFVWTGAPVARGLKILNIEFNDFPVSGNAEAKFIGYTYESNSVKINNQLRNSDGTEDV
jgi:hypothetical protein